MKRKLEIFFTKLNIAACAIGTYAMAFMTSDFIRRDLPFDFVSACGLIICNMAVLYLFVEAGFDLHKILDDYEYEEDEPTITAQGFNEDFYDAYFKE